MNTTNGMPDLKPVMTTREFAEALQISIDEVKRLGRQRHIHPLRGYKCPKCYAGTEIARWLRGEVRT